MCNKDTNQFCYVSPIIFQEKPLISSEIFLMLFYGRTQPNTLMELLGLHSQAFCRTTLTFAFGFGRTPNKMEPW